MKKILLITIFLVTSLSSQEWTKYDLEDLNLYSRGLYDLDFDSDNNVWIASLSGLLKFNGNEWSVFDTNNSDIGWNRLLSVAVDKENNIWVGKTIRNGLSKFDGQEWEHINEDNTPEIDIYSPSDIVFDKNDVIWLDATYYLYTFQNDKWYYYQYKPREEFNEPDIREIVIDKENIVWFTTKFHGLYKLNNNNLQKFVYGSPTHRYEGLAIDSSNNVWFVNGSNSLVHYNQSTKQWTLRDTTVTPLHNNSLKKNIIAVDRHNNLWIAEDRSVHFFNTFDETWISYSIPENLQPINSPVLFNDFKIDNHGNLWFLSQSAGVFKLSGVISTIENEEEIENEITLFPNPTESYIKIENTEQIHISNYDIIDITGKTVQNDRFSSSQIDISNLRNGVYFIKLYYNNTFIQKKLVIK